MSPLLALFARSLREDSRTKFTYLTRAGFVLVLLLFLLSIQNEMGWSNAPGLQFFKAVIYIDLIVILLAGASYFASAITEEKEEMTLGLLRMTNLNPLAILLGKSTSRLCGALLLLAAQIPFTLLAVTLGGVSLRQVIAAYCTLGAFVVMLANLALLASVVARRTGAAAVLTCGALFGFFAVVPAASWLAQLPVRFRLLTASAPWVSALNSLAAFADSASPFTRCFEIFGTGFDGAPFTLQAGSNLALGAGCFLLAWAVFEIFCGEQKEAAPARGPVARRGLLRRVFGPGRAWRRAVVWKEFYFTAGGRFRMLFSFILFGLLLIAVWEWPQKYGGPVPRAVFGGITLSIMGVILIAELSVSAAGFLRVERRWQTLSSLATLPQGIRRVAFQKLLGLLPTFIPVCTYLLLGLACLAPEIRKGISSIHISHPNDFIFALFALSGLAQFVFFLYLTAALSLWVKRGALPLAVGIQFILNSFLSTAVGAFAFAHHELSSWIGASVLLLLICYGIVALHVQIGRRLELLAAEE